MPIRRVVRTGLMLASSYTAGGGGGGAVVGRRPGMKEPTGSTACRLAATEAGRLPRVVGGRGLCGMFGGKRQTLHSPGRGTAHEPPATRHPRAAWMSYRGLMC